MPFCQLTLKASKPQSSAYPDTLSTLGDHLRAKRLDRNLTQGEAARLIGVDECSVYNWEGHRTTPELRLLPIIILFLDYCPYKPGLSRQSILRTAREYAGLSRRKLAEALYVDEGTLALCEREGSAQTKKREAVAESALKLLFDGTSAVNY